MDGDMIANILIIVGLIAFLAISAIIMRKTSCSKTYETSREPETEPKAEDEEKAKTKSRLIATLPKKNQKRNIGKVNLIFEEEKRRNIWVCRVCGTENLYSTKICETCGEKR